MSTRWNSYTRNYHGSPICCNCSGNSCSLCPPVPRSQSGRPCHRKSTIPHVKAQCSTSKFTSNNNLAHRNVVSVGILYIESNSIVCSIRARECRRKRQHLLRNAIRNPSRNEENQQKYSVYVHILVYLDESIIAKELTIETMETAADLSLNWKSYSKNKQQRTHFFPTFLF